MVELALVLGTLGGLLATGIGAATWAPDSPLLWFIEGCCLYAVSLIVILELRPRVVALRVRMTALRRFRKQLAQLPEAPHPGESKPADPHATRSGVASRQHRGHQPDRHSHPK